MVASFVADFVVSAVFFQDITGAVVVTFMFDVVVVVVEDVEPSFLRQIFKNIL
jgi:hypothetical protein